MLEGSVDNVHTVFQRISQDERHFNLIELMRDYAPARRFGHAGMALFDLRDYQKMFNSIIDYHQRHGQQVDGECLLAQPQMPGQLESVGFRVQIALIALALPGNRHRVSVVNLLYSLSWIQRIAGLSPVKP